MKEELVDEGYDSAEWSSLKRGHEDEESMMVAKRIKEEMGREGRERANEERPDEHRQQDRQMQRQHERREMREIIRSPPNIIFDHFICMRIGLNSENNVQKLMAILTAHNFVDLTVIPGASIAPTILPPIIHHPIIHQPEPTTSRHQLLMEPREITLAPRAPPKKYAPRRQPGDLLPTIPAVLKCMKCHEVMGTGSSCNTVLAHVQKFHLKMAAFQCRICKHYRTTQERIQSHVTTVHKARSTTFDDSLAGPISAQDMSLMERMIAVCFPDIVVKLEITDRLSVKSFTYGKQPAKANK